MTADVSGSLDEQLRLAIAEKRLIQLRYDGRLRVVEPHDYGVQKGTVALLAFQLRSSDGPSKAPGWRRLHISKVSECSVLKETFKGSRAKSHEHHYTWGRFVRARQMR